MAAGKTAAAQASALMKDAARLESGNEYHEAVARLEQAKAVLMDDKDAAAAGHGVAIERINTRTAAIFTLLRKELYVTLGTWTTSCACAFVSNLLAVLHLRLRHLAWAVVDLSPPCAFAVYGMATVIL